MYKGKTRYTKAIRTSIRNSKNNSNNNNNTVSARRPIGLSLTDCLCTVDVISKYIVPITVTVKGNTFGDVCAHFSHLLNFLDLFILWDVMSIPLLHQCFL